MSRRMDGGPLLLRYKRDMHDKLIYPSMRSLLFEFLVRAHLSKPCMRSDEVGSSEEEDESKATEPPEHSVALDMAEKIVDLVSGHISAG